MKFKNLYILSASLLIACFGNTSLAKTPGACKMYTVDEQGRYGATGGLDYAGAGFTTEITNGYWNLNSSSDVYEGMDLSKKRYFVATNHSLFVKKYWAKDSDGKGRPGPGYGSDPIPFEQVWVKCGDIKFKVNRSEKYSRPISFKSTNYFVMKNSSDMAIYEIDESSVTGGKLEDISGFDPRAYLTNDDDNGSTAYMAKPDGSPDYSNPCRLENSFRAWAELHCQKNFDVKAGEFISGTVFYIQEKGASDIYKNGRSVPLALGILKTGIPEKGIVELELTNFKMDTQSNQKVATYMQH